jgi:ArsR family transcriptional regulator, cadmium/lead-responsive transcriptional repressor
MSTNTRQRVDVAVGARLFSSLGDPTRLAILLSLLGGESRVGEIVELVGSTQSNVSNHLACLKGCGLVVDRPGERRQVFYSIAHPEVTGLLAAADELLAATGEQVELCAHPAMAPQRSGRDG